MPSKGSQQKGQTGSLFLGDLWGGMGEWGAPLCPCFLPHTHFHVVHVDDVPTVIQVLLQVLVQVLKDKGEGLLRVDNIM